MPWTKLPLAVPALLLLGLAGVAPGDDAAAIDEETLKAAKLAADPAAVVAFLRSQTLPDKDREQIEALVRQLGDERFTDREEASDRLTVIGIPAVPFLREASRSANLEVERRASQCLADIGGSADPAVTAAAIRCLARHQPADAAAVLLEFFPFAGEEWIEDEVLNALGTLAVHAGKPEKLLAAALQDPLPARRAAAVGVLARCGDVEQRTLVRRMLADPDAKVRAFAAHGLLGDRWSRLDVPLRDEDRKVLKTAHVAPDAAGLLAFFRQRTLGPDERKRLLALVQQLDSDTFATRQDAERKLTEIGTPVLPFLQAVLDKKDNSLDLVRRIEKCKKEIERGPGPALPMAAARLLVRRAPPEAVPVLLDYVPFADDGAVEDEVLSCLAQLAVQGPRVPPSLRTALRDELPPRRGSAALVLGLVGDKDDCAALRALLADAEASVRLRAGQGLLAARDREAMPALLGLLGDAPLPLALQAEELLRHVGGEKAPPESVGDPGDDGRKKAHESWVAWWREQGDKVNLSDGPQGASFLNLTLVAELTSNNGTGGNRILEFGADGRPRWEVKDLQFPIDAHWLRGDRLLIAEYNAQRVLERDRSGKIVWEKKVNGNPVSCQRLANGNTVIATYTHVLEVTPGGTERYNLQVNTLTNGQQVYNAVKLRNGSLACVTGAAVVLVTPEGKKLKDWMLGANNFNWSSVEELPGGRLLLAFMGTGKVLEIGPDGKPLWEAHVPGCCHAVRLPNGNTLVACMQQQKVVEVNRAGKTVWEKATAGRPFHVRRR